MDTTSIKGNIKPTIIQLLNGGFRRDDDEVIKADGQFHKVSGDGYVDETSITIASDHSVKEIDKVHGKLAYTVEYIVSPDGNTLTWHVASFTSPNGQAVKSETVQRRVGFPVKGAHLISGKWERVSVTVGPKHDWILKLEGAHFSSRTVDGSGFDAFIGGKPVKIDGDASGARALITRPRPDTIVETDFSSKGERETVLTLQMMPDKNTIRGVALVVKDKKPTTFYLHKVRE